MYQCTNPDCKYHQFDEAVVAIIVMAVGEKVRSQFCEECESLAYFIQDKEIVNLQLIEKLPALHGVLCAIEGHPVEQNLFLTEPEPKRAFETAWFAADKIFNQLKASVAPNEVKFPDIDDFIEYIGGEDLDEYQIELAQAYIDFIVVLNRGSMSAGRGKVKDLVHSYLEEDFRWIQIPITSMDRIQINRDFKMAREQKIHIDPRKENERDNENI